MTASSAHDHQPVLRLSGPADVVEALPYLVGFTPRDSVVLVALAGGRGRVALTARVDVDHDPVRALAPAWPAAVGEGADAVIVVVYDEARTGDVLPHVTVVEELQGQARAHGLVVRDALCVGATHFWSYLCQSSACCPREGRPVPSDGAVSAELVFNGQPKVSTREDLRGELAVDEARARALADLLLAESPTARRLRTDGREIAFLDRLIDEGDINRRPDAELARALRALSRTKVRDAQLIDRGREGERAAAQCWADLAGVAPAPWDAAPLTLLAVCAYRRGDGARANIAIEAASESDPSYSLAALVGVAITSALTPRSFSQDLDEEARRIRSAALEAGGR